MKKITAILTIFNGEQFLPAVLDSLNKFVDKLVVLEGCVELNDHMSKSFTSTDKSLDIIRENSKILSTVIITKKNYWKNKSEMLNKGLEFVDSEWVLLASDDEVYKEEDIIKIKKEIEKSEEKSFLIPHYHFWKAFDKYITGDDWDVLHLRLFKIGKNYSFRNIETLIDEKGTAIYQGPHGKKGKVLDDVHIYHYSNMKPSQYILDKTIFYLRRKGSKSSIACISASVKKGHGYFIGVDKKRLKDFNIKDHPNSIKKMDMFKKAMRSK